MNRSGAPSPPETSDEEVQLQDPSPSPPKLGKESVKKKKPASQAFKTDEMMKYDVFLSFEGADTRRYFTDHLYEAFAQRGILAFRDDDELERSDSISPQITKAIEEARFIIVILSINYASSTRCLDELVMAFDCQKVIPKKVIPIFCDVDPSEVRRQAGSFGEAFSKHTDALISNTETVQRWKDALTHLANLSGWNLQDHRNGAKAIQDIIHHVSFELNSTALSMPKDLVAMDSRVEKVLSYLDLSRSDDVLKIGICGMGGIGKTTVALVVFDRIRFQFDCCSFLANVREATSSVEGLVHLQERLLKDTIGSMVNIYSIDRGRSIISQRLQHKKVLIIVDDATDFEQLESLCDCVWFGHGSRIIITSRDKRLLEAYGVDEIYEVEPLNHNEALQLFSLTCFKKDQVEDDFLELSTMIVDHARGLPFALQVLGGTLHSRSQGQWLSALNRLDGHAYAVSEITDILKVSYDGLEENEKELFLDIACFFQGEDIDRVTRILESCGLYPTLSIQILLDKSLVTLAGRKLLMHNLIQNMGWDIVKRECLHCPGRRSRLWFHEDITYALKHNQATAAIKGIFLNSPEQEDVHLTSDPFSEMPGLRFLKVHNVKFSGNLKYLSNGLRLLDWHSYPLKSLPSNFQAYWLVELIMHSSHIKQLWSGIKHCHRLKLIDLRDSEYLIETPDLSGVPELETLVLEGCTSLVTVHPSIGFLEKLALLNMRNCISVERLPPLRLKSLELLSVSGCSKLKDFPVSVGSLGCLLELHLNGTAIVEVPESIERLTALTLLNIEDCVNLYSLPSSIKFLTSLKKIKATGCSKLTIVPEDLGSLERLEEPDKERRGKEAEWVSSELHSPIENVQEENKLETRNVKENVVIEEDKSSPEHLQGLFLYCSLFPENFEFRKHELVQLWIAEGLDMKETKQETMEDAGIEHFNALESRGFFLRSRCDFQMDFDSVFSVPVYSPSSYFYKVNPVVLPLLENRSSGTEYFRSVDGKLDRASESMTKHLSLLSGHGSSIKRVPADLFMSLNFLTTLNLSQTLISGLPSSIGDVQPLRYIDVSYTLITRLPESIGSLTKLQTLKLRGCKDLFDLPRSMHRLAALRHLDIDIIRQLDCMPAHLGSLSNLQSLSAFLVGRDDGRRIRELKNLNDLGGALRIFRLENVLSKADAEDVDLKSKKRLQRLDLRWTKLMGENNKMQDDILESLQPPQGLKELQILFYNGTRLPSWLSNTSITDLVLITLYKCANCELLPSLGRLPKLKFLSIVEMNKVNEIDQTFFRSSDHPEPFKAFPELEILEIDIMLNLKEWRGVKEGDLESLIKLTMESCPELVTVPSLSCLKSLKYIEFNHCPKLLSFDCSVLPTSLESLIIRDCPELKEWCQEEGHQDLGRLKSYS